MSPITVFINFVFYIYICVIHDGQVRHSYLSSHWAVPTAGLPSSCCGCAEAGQVVSAAEHGSE